MSRRSFTLPPALQALRTEALQRWGTLPPRQRLAVGVASVLLAIGLVWMVGVAPALRTLREVPPQLDALDLQLQSMQRLAAEARQLRETPPVPVAQAEQALKSASSRLEAKGTLTLQGNRATLSLAGVNGEELRAWLAETRSGARARAVEAQLSRVPQGYAGTIVVTVGSAP